MKRQGPRTAAEVVAERDERLRTDHQFAAQIEVQEDQRQSTASANGQAERAVLEDLRKVGVDLDTVWNLYKFPELRKQAVPVLLRHLVLDYPDHVLQGIGQGLVDKSTRPWWDELKALYLQPQRPPVRDRLAAALAECAKREQYPDLLTFVRDPSLGESRVYFLRPINRIGNRITRGQGREVVRRLVADPTLGREATAVVDGLRPNDG